MRILAKIETKTGHVVKGRQLEGVRKLGNPAEFARRYYDIGVDEIVFMDSVASLYGRKTLDGVVRDVGSVIFVPMCVGGGIASLADCDLMFDSGADKVSLNTALFADITLIDRIGERYGSQAVVVEVQAKKLNGRYMCVNQYGREETGIELTDWLTRIRGRMIGEVSLTAVNHDGVAGGVDWDLIEAARPHIDVPLVYGGGFNPEIDDIQALSYWVEGLAIATSLHNNRFNPAAYSERCTR
ncbi:UNVERIFIED_ORG: cyclase [Shinella zoogloeoides]|nr:cyclase [Shinella zoogloeoides]